MPRLDTQENLFGDLVTRPELKDRPVLSEAYLIPPFTILDSRSGYWQARKRWWKSLGIESELGREHVELFSPALGKYVPTLPNQGKTSIFDPVLAETLYRWFCPPDGVVLDPFAGGSVRGIVAGKLELSYLGVDLAQIQVDANRKQADAMNVADTVYWRVGDATLLGDTVAEDEKFDFLLACPPYFDLEKYSDDPRDLSNMTWEEFCDAYSWSIQLAASHLAENRFAAFVVSNMRDTTTGFYRDFTGVTQRAFEAAGCRLYNECVLLNSLGSAPARAAKQFNGGRKLVRCHQEVLVFCKGDPWFAAQACRWPEEARNYGAELVNPEGLDSISALPTKEEEPVTLEEYTEAMPL